MYRDQPQHQVEEWLGELMWQDHPLGRSLTGTPQTLRGLSRAEILRFKDRMYGSVNTLIAFAGRVEHDACVANIGEFWRRRRSGTKPVFGRVNGAVAQGRLRVQSKDIEQTHVALGVRLFGRNDQRRYALKLLSVMLGENMSSRLFQVVREKHGLAYAIQSGLHLFAETGVLDITAGLDRGRTDKALDLIVREMVRMKDKPVGPAELKRAKEYAIGQIRLGLEGTTNQMMWIGDNFLSYGRFITPEVCIARLNEVTAEDVQRLARGIFGERHTSVALVAPDLKVSDEEKIVTCLERLG